MNLAASVRVETAVCRWLDDVVIGLGLCPFAAQPVRDGRLRICISEARDELALLTELQLELQRLDDTPSIELETTIIALPLMLADFADYNDFLDRVDELLERGDWQDDYQVASFHPQYQFADTGADDAENYTNRSPYPLLHLLREDSVEAGLASHPDPAQIPRDNILRMQRLSSEQRKRLFDDALVKP